MSILLHDSAPDYRETGPLLMFIRRRSGLYLFLSANGQAAIQRDERCLAEAGEEAVGVMMNCRQEIEVQKTRMNIGCQIRIRVDSSGEKDQRALLNRQERVIIIRGSSKKSDVHGQHRTCPAAVQEG